MIEALLEAYRLKAVDRAGWLRVGVAHPESVAAHSWGIALLVLALLPEQLDRGRALTNAALHDLPEAITGDLIPSDGVSRQNKHLRELAAMDRMALPSAIRSAWDAYEAQADPEARFVKQLDRLDMAIQAWVYQHHGTHEFVRSAAAFVTHPVLTPLIKTIQAKMGD